MNNTHYRLPGTPPRNPPKMAGFILPGLFGSANWDTTTTLAYPAQIAGFSANWVCMDSLYYTDNWGSSNIITTSAISDAALGDLCVKTKQAGLKFSLKPHLRPNDGSNQIFTLPGAVWSKDLSNINNPWIGTYTNGTKTVACTAWNLTNANIGDRIVTPTFGHRNEIPNSGYADAYARSATPAYTTITAVAGDGKSCTISNAVTASSNNSVVAILHDANNDTFFTNWINVIDHMLSVCATACTTAGITAAPVDGISVITELDHLMRYYPNKFRQLIAHVNVTYPNMQFWSDAGAGLTDYGSVPFADALDYIGISSYPTVGSQAGGDTQSYVDANWTAATNGLAGYAQAWGKPIIFAEVGACSVPGAGYNPSAPPTGTGGQSPATDQNAFVQGMFDTVWTQPWFGGFQWWVWSGPAGSREVDSYSPYNKQPTQTTFKTYLSANV